MIVRAPAKLTVSLRMTGRRADGYHLIDAEMVSLDLADTLTFSDGDGISVDGPQAEGVPTDATNLVARALRAIGRQARVHLDKQIPVQGGLGGGSSDAAAVLRWAGRADLDHDVGLAVGLGADVAFCLHGGRARVTGIGEVIEVLPFEARTYTLCVPPVGVSTAAAYRAFDEIGSVGETDNDLTAAAFTVQPSLREWWDRFGSATGQQVHLAGSGSTMFVVDEHPVVIDGASIIVARTVPGY